MVPFRSYYSRYDSFPLHRNRKLVRFYAVHVLPFYGGANEVVFLHRVWMRLGGCLLLYFQQPLHLEILGVSCLKGRKEVFLDGDIL
jgi:hypothetical protein